ncbi:hypothetical protein PRIPAC_94457, partial [Pristionchus pacificus]|uniref:Uncharacterized protein n=1 Tax=Pristionchus pacificus TaxID=54126 RepID=A0A2A6C9C2_PRIPA
TFISLRLIRSPSSNYSSSSVRHADASSSSLPIILIRNFFHIQLCCCLSENIYKVRSIDGKTGDLVKSYFYGDDTREKRALEFDMDKNPNVLSALFSSSGLSDRHSVPLCAMACLVRMEVSDEDSAGYRTTARFYPRILSL